MITRYHYTTLWHQQSLGDAGAVPFAVIIESHRYVYCIGVQMPGDGTIAGQVLANFPAVLKERVEAAAREARRGRLAIDALLRDFTWNIRAEAPRSRTSLKSIEEFAHRLFVKRVEKWAPVPKAAKRPMRKLAESLFVLNLPAGTLATA